MDTKSIYKTKQREQLLSYMMTIPNTHFTVNDVCGHFKAHGSSIGVATVYRHLERMVDEGIVTKYILDTSAPACFEYTGGAHRGGEVCFHCKCEKCGRLIHMHCDELAGIKEHLKKHHDFELNSMRTVFYGLCGECSSAVNSVHDSGK